LGSTMIKGIVLKKREYFQFPLLGSDKSTNTLLEEIAKLSIPLIGFVYINPSGSPGARKLSIPLIGFIEEQMWSDEKKIVNFQFPLLGSDSKGESHEVSKLW